MVTVQGDSLELPSEGIYTKFKAGLDCSEEGDWQRHSERVRREVGTTLNLFGIDKSFASDIAKGLCYACAQSGGNSSSDDTYCYFLYYWIGGNVMKKEMSHQEFKRVMKAIYKALNEGGSMCNCSTAPYDIHDIVFYESKELFDYSYNYGTMGKISEGWSELCGEKYESYLQKITEVYGRIQRCREDDDSDCAEIEKKYKDYFNGKELNLECSKADKPQPEPLLQTEEVQSERETHLSEPSETRPEDRSGPAHERGKYRVELYLK
ncbi:KIR-like CYIR protein [Plasmodium cynomolgi strain B]|uniref:KIR-like CYIR protein n=1 Tax=Plasmodium cynomolgi (strain B) TaxID=1120755 RepID=K6UI90_PLACD|nr:KIR-like CYIR protein [Plasmodium cynomolgi strain B]GAB64813.1 KIR-like CYIR protein [Plasmodium cynomolgi strain B]